MAHRIEKTDAEWQQQLTPEQYRITRKKGTEPAFSGQYYPMKDPGMYHCVCCGEPLFSSAAKYESGSGWPSFWKPVAEESMAVARDIAHGMERMEIMCSHCGAHLGHVFEDGPQPTGLRYCVNSASLDFKPHVPAAETGASPSAKAGI